MKLSERIREEVYPCGDYDWMPELEQLEADITTLENEAIRLEDENDALKKKNEALMRLAGMYIKSYEDLAFGDADMATEE